MTGKNIGKGAIMFTMCGGGGNIWLQITLDHIKIEIKTRGKKILEQISRT